MPQPIPPELARSEENLAPEPDRFFLGNSGTRMTDGGPVYQESPLDPFQMPSGSVAEPFNTITAGVFIIIALVWFWRLRGRYRQFPFVVFCLPILLVGGIGGTLYHMHRTRFIYFLLDVLPISFLGLAGAVALCLRIGRGAGWKRITLAAIGAALFYLFLNDVLFRGIFYNMLASRPHMIVNISYASLATVLLVPLVIVLIRTRFQHGWFVVAALCSFAQAWFFRLVDRTDVVRLSMGTHWLWHLFGALTTWLIFEYFYRLERDDRAPIVAAGATLPSLPR